MPALVLDAVDEMPVVETRTATGALAHVEADRVDDVQAAAGRGCRAPDGAGVVGDLRMQEDDLEARLPQHGHAAAGRRAQCDWPGSRSQA